MLEGVDGVNWSALTHAHGPADDVPGNLQALISHDQRAARAALQKLGRSIFHQGSVNEATVAAIPFLAEVALAPSVNERIRVHVLVLLAAAANPYFVGEVERDCRAAVARVLPSLKKLLEEPSIVRLGAAEVFGMVPAAMDPAPPALIDLRDEAKEPALKLVLDIAVARIEGRDAHAFIERLTEIDDSFRAHREVWEDASGEATERSALEIVLEGAISGELRRAH